jgi:acetoacetyl-CoA reductase
MTKNISDTVMNKIIEAIPVRRLGQPHEIARAVLFLADENAGYVTGSTISVNGGQYMQ